MRHPIRIPSIIVLLLISLLMISSLDAQTITQEPTLPPEPTVSALTPDPVAAAQALLDRAEERYNSTQNTINLFIGFFGIVLAILSLLGAVATGLGLFNNGRLTKYKERVSEVEQLQQSLKRDSDTLKQQLADATALRQDIKQALEAQARETEKTSLALTIAQLGTRQVDLGNNKAALELFLEACDLVPSNRLINYFVGDLYLRTGDYENGKKYLNTAREGRKFLPADASYAYALRLEGDRHRTQAIKDKIYAEAEALFLDVSRRDPDLRDISGESAFGALAGLYRRRGEADTQFIAQAISWYEHARRVTPQNSYPVNNLALLHYRYSGEPFADRNQALAYFRESRKKARYALSFNQSYWRLFDLIIAETALCEVKIEEIIPHIERALELQPPDVDIAKLLESLELMKASLSPSDLVDKVIAEIKSRQN